MSGQRSAGTCRTTQLHTCCGLTPKLVASFDTPPAALIARSIGRMGVLHTMLTFVVNTLCSVNTHAVFMLAG
jgi:hypothetical protein